MTRFFNRGRGLFSACLLSGTMLLGVGCGDDLSGDVLLPVPGGNDDRGVGEGGPGSEFFIPDAVPGSRFDLPDRLIKEPGPGFGLFSMRDNLFWFGVRETNCCDIQNILLTTTVRGGTPEVIADLDHTPIAPAADDSRIFWADAYNKDIYVVDTETRLIDKVLSPSAQPVALEVDESSIFFGAADGRIYRADKGGGVIEDLTGTNELPLQLAVYGETVYWTTLSDDGRTGSLLSYALNRGETQELLSGFDFSAGFIVDDGRLMWADNSLRAIMSMDRNGGEAVVIAPRQYDMGYLVQNRFELYFSSLSDSTIRRITKTGTVNDVLAINQDEPGELLVTDDRLYWFNESNGSILFLGL